MIIAEQAALPLGVLREEARLAGAPVLYSGEAWSGDWHDGAFVYAGQRLNVRAPWLGLPGAHQAQNAGAACAAIEVLGGVLNDGRITAEAMAAGLRECTWPGRLQQLKPGPLSGTAAVWIDAAHNQGGAASLARAILAVREAGERVAVVIAIQAAKDFEAVLRELRPVTDVFVVCPLPDSGGQEGGPGADPREVAETVKTLGGRAAVAGDLMQAVRVASEAADRVYIAGSVYLCGAALALNGEQVE